MDKYHQKAEDVRAAAGYSGGSDGGAYILTPSSSLSNSASRSSSNNNSSNASSSNNRSSGIGNSSNMVKSVTNLAIFNSVSNGLSEASSNSSPNMDYLSNFVELLIIAAINDDKELIDHIFDYIDYQNRKRTSEIIPDIDPNARIILSTVNRNEAEDILVETQKLTSDKLKLGSAAFTDVIIIRGIVEGYENSKVIGYPVYIENKNDEGTKPNGTKLIRILTVAKNRTIIEYSENTWGASISNRDNAQNGIGADAMLSSTTILTTVNQAHCSVTPPAPVKQSF